MAQADAMAAGRPIIAATNRSVTTLLRLEGGLALAGAAVAYHALGGSWTLFALLFLLPDVSMLGYVTGPRLGAATYNAAHTYTVPGCLVGLAWAMGLSGMLGVAVIWLAHIGFDRLLGYGLKFPDDFKITHLGMIGQQPIAADAQCRHTPVR